MKITACFKKTLKSLFTKDVVKAVLLTSVPIFLFYFIILVLFWKEIINFSYFLISWVPFSVLKINGAFFILFFLWFVSVALSFAFLTAILGPVILNKIKERGFYFYTISLITFFSVLYAFLFISNWDFINSEVQKFLTLLPFDTVSKGVGALVAVYIFYNLFILTLFVMLFFVGKEFLYAIKELEYPNLEINVEDKFKYKRTLIKDILIFIFLFVLLFPLFFIPIINIGVQIFLWTKIYHDSFIYYVCNEYCSNQEFEELQKHKFKTIFIAIIAASFNFLPIINFFAPFFAIIMFFHCIMQLKTSTNV